MPRPADNAAMRTAVVVVALLFASGCWVGEELDQGDKLLEQHAGKRIKKAKERKGAPAAPEAEAAPARKSEGPGILAELTTWASKKLEGPPPPPDPGDAPVRCFVGDRQLFTSRYDCEAQRGRVVELPPKP
jgi:hypothetical protein